MVPVIPVLNLFEGRRLTVSLTRPALAGFAAVLVGLAMIAFAAMAGTAFGQEETPTPGDETPTVDGTPTPVDETPEAGETPDATPTTEATPGATSTPSGGPGALPETGSGSAAGDSFPAWLLGAGVILAVAGSAFALTGARRRL